MPSKNPTLRVVVSESEKTVIEAMAKAVGKSVSTFLKDLALGSQQVSQPNEVSQPSNPYTVGNISQVSQPVCVLGIGDKLPTAYELKPHKVERYSTTYRGHKRDWYVFPEDRVVAIWNKSANGAKTWLEVALHYPQTVWVEAIKVQSFAANPVSTLMDFQARFDRVAPFESQPAIAEAIAKGWQYDWVQLKGEDTASLLTSIAAQYLNDLPIADVEPDSAVDEVPSVLTINDLAARLTPQHLALSNAKSAKAKDRVIADLPLVLNDMKEKTCTTWTSARDIEGYAWLPVDATREEWARQPKLA